MTATAAQPADDSGRSDAIEAVREATDQLGRATEALVRRLEALEVVRESRTPPDESLAAPTSMPPGLVPAASLDPDRKPRAPTDFSTEDYADAAVALRAVLDARLAQLEEAREPDPYSTFRGASNFPTDCTIWAADWRENLPLEHPLRQIGPALRATGTVEASATMEAARQTLLQAASGVVVSSPSRAT
jgi:hypothetical protein